MSTPETKSVILDAAERLFAREGFAATSLRRIVAEARVNLAAVNYHFGSKQGLIRALFERRLDFLNQERLQALDAVETAAGRKAPPLAQVVRAFVAPALRLSRDSQPGGLHFMRVLGRTFIEPDETLQKLLIDLLQETITRFTAAFQRALPELPPPDFYWRLHFSVGAMAHTMCGHERIKLLSGGAVDPADVESALEQLVNFIVGGLRSPATPHPALPGGKRKLPARSLNLPSVLTHA